MRTAAWMAGAAGAAVVLAWVHPAAGQTGTLDQTSPAVNASFNLDASFLQWQQQTHAGIAGQLEGVQLTLQGVVGAQATVRIRLGATWNLSPIVFSTIVTKATANQEVVFVPMTSANIHLVAGDVYVIETQGNGTGMGLIGSYVAPPGTPMYPEPLFLNAAVQGDGGWKHGFQTYMLTGGPECYPNCDESTAAPRLNVADFTCFLTKYVAGDAYANCDQSTTAPVLNVADFSCFLTKYVAGCT